MQPDDPMQFLPHLGNGPARFQLLPNVRPQRPQFFLVESVSGEGRCARWNASFCSRVTASVGAGIL